MPSLQIKRRSKVPADPLVRIGTQQARTRAVLVAVTFIALSGSLIAIPLVRAVLPAAVQTVAPVVVRAVTPAPGNAYHPSPKTSVCTRIHIHAGTAHRHVCS